MNLLRRTVLKQAASFMTLVATGASGMWSVLARAAERNEGAFRAEKVADTIKDLGVANAAPSQDIRIKAPEIAENGAVVPVEVTSGIPGTESITIVTDNNPFPLTAIFNVNNGAEGYVATRIKMGKTSTVDAYVKAGGKDYVASREVKVTIGGCGG